MKAATKFVLGAGAALSLGLAVAVASAHPFAYGPGAGFGPGAGMGPGHAMGWGMGPGAGAFGHGYGHGGMGGYGDPAAAAEARLAYMKSALKITPAQETAWQAFTAKVKQQAASRLADRTATVDAARLTAPDRLAKRAEIMKENTARMEAMGTAFKDLYSALTPEQRSILDHGMGGWGHGRGFRG